MQQAVYFVVMELVSLEKICRISPINFNHAIIKSKKPLATWLK
jgi:hypothetical protein